MAYILFDIGGFKTSVAISKDLETIDNIKTFKTPTTYKTGLEKMIAAVEDLKKKTKLEALAGGVRGCTLN